MYIMILYLHNTGEKGAKCPLWFSVVPCTEHIYVQNSLILYTALLDNILEQMASINRWTIGIHDSVGFFNNTSKILSLTDLNNNR